MKSGRLDIHKPKGMTSHDVVHRIRQKLGIKRVGHSGTLDPLAEGVLSVYVGRATKFIDLLKNSYKTYDVWFEYGKYSDTFDIMGTVVETSLPDIDFERFERVAETFLGKQLQVPPMYSAIKVNGQPLYRYARAGIELERKAREIEITELEVLEWDGVRGRIVLTCSKGTYIRSFIVDLAKRLGTSGIMTRLIRLENDYVRLEDCLSLEDVTEEAIREPDAFHPGPRLAVSSTQLQHLVHGQFITLPSDLTAERVLLTHDGSFVGTAKRSATGYLREKIYYDISSSE